MTRDPGILLLACAASILAACGQKGPLYLPGDPSQIRTEIPPLPADRRPEQAPREDEEEPDDEDQ